MRKAEILHVRDETLREFAVCEISVSFLVHPRPGREVAFVYRHGTLAGVPGRALLHPAAVGPVEFLQAAEDRTGRRRALGLECDRVGAVRQELAVGTLHLELVARARRQFRNEQLPDPRGIPQPHGMGPPVPIIEIADEADAACRRRPHREEKTVDRADGPAMGAEHVVVGVAADVAGTRKTLVVQNRTEGVGIVSDERAVRGLDPQPVPWALLRLDTVATKKPASLRRSIGARTLASVGVEQIDREGVRDHRADLPFARGNLVRAEHGERDRNDRPRTMAAMASSASGEGSGGRPLRSDAGSFSQRS